MWNWHEDIIDYKRRINMNTTAFVVSLVVGIGYYFYTVRKERSKHEHDKSQNISNSEGGDT